MTSYTIDLSRHTSPEAAGAVLAELVAPKVTCPYCHQPTRTYQVAGATMLKYHRDPQQEYEWCDYSDYNMSEATE